jgi:phosphatidate cytidylyltransferase
LLVLLTAFSVGLEELARLLGWGSKSRLLGWAYTLAGWAFVALGSSSALAFFCVVSILFGAGCISVSSRKVERAHPMAWLGAGWLLMPVLCMAVTHGWWKGGSLHPVALYGLSLFAGDTMALVVGKLIGKTPLAPTLSAGKTWEGAAGAFLGSMACAFGFGLGFGYGADTCFLLGAITGTLGTAGDLFESHMKRRQGVKDSGEFFPGHGGVLDRVDSMMMTAIPCCLVLVLLEPQMFHVKQLLGYWLR